MAHNIESMFSVRQTPWHGLGHVVDSAPTAAEAIKLAGLDWQVLEKPVYQRVGEAFQAIPDQKAITRSSDDSVLSIMTNNYQPLQNAKAFEFFNPFIDSGLAAFETAGSLRQGKVVWILATLNRAPIEVGKGGDVVNKHLLLSNSHDGSMAVRVGFTPIRVVCNNTLSAAHRDGDSKLLRIKHAGNLQANLDNVQAMVNALDARFDATAAQYNALANCSVNAADLANYVNVIFDLNPAGDERAKLRAKKMQETITKLFENGAGAQLQSARGTLWGAYNAVTEYLTHDHGKNIDGSRLNSNWFGENMRTNDFALETALRAL